MAGLVGISCDGCSATYSGTTWGRAAFGPVRADAKDLGWWSGMRTLPTRDGHTIRVHRDFCAVCVITNKHREPEAPV